MAATETKNKTKSPFDESESEPILDEKKVEEMEAKPEELESQIDLLDPVALAEEVTLTHPGTGESKTFIQKELAFIPKTRLLSLVATTIRAAADQEGSGNIGDIVSDMFGGVNDLIAQGVDPTDAENFAANQFMDIIIRLVEIAPEFLDQLFLLVLNVKPKDKQWVLDSLEVIDDEQGVAILDAAIAQNGKALKDFFDKHLRKVLARVQNMNLVEGVTGQE